MKSFTKILIAVLLVAAVLLPIAGCKKNTGSDTGASSTDAKTDSTSASEGDISLEPESETTEVAQESVYVVDTKQKELKMCKGPSADADTVQEIPKGAEVEVEEKADGWAKIKYEDKTGWVRSDNITKVAKTEKSTRSLAASKTSETTKAQSTTTSKESTVKTTSAKTTTVKDSTAKATTSKSTSKEETTTGSAVSSTTSAKQTTKSTASTTGSQKPATVHIRIHGRKSGDKEITAKVNPGESYTGLMAYKTISEKFPGESVRIEGDPIVNYDPSTGIGDFYMDAYFNDAIEITITEED
ncbi:MAG: SH3 domain-containing protein [Clostridia bacterium]|nr:SH3 domain-containing protein [Clostridia bacterium]